MRRMAEAWQRIGALCACLIVALSLAAAPAAEAVKHGPGALAAEADHRAWHTENGQSHAMPSGSHGHHDSGDHDHVVAAILVASGSEVAFPPKSTLRPETLAADGTIRDGPRRPPRLTVI